MNRAAQLSWTLEVWDRKVEIPTREKLAEELSFLEGEPVLSIVLVASKGAKSSWLERVLYKSMGVPLPTSERGLLVAFSGAWAHVTFTRLEQEWTACATQEVFEPPEEIEFLTLNREPYQARSREMIPRDAAISMLKAFFLTGRRPTWQGWVKAGG